MLRAIFRACPSTRRRSLEKNRVSRESSSDDVTIVLPVTTDCALREPSAPKTAGCCPGRWNSPSGVSAHSKPTWEITVRPDGTESETVVLPVTIGCAAGHAICTRRRQTTVQHAPVHRARTGSLDSRQPAQPGLDQGADAACPTQPRCPRTAGVGPDEASRQGQRQRCPRTAGIDYSTSRSRVDSMTMSPHRRDRPQLFYFRLPRPRGDTVGQTSPDTGKRSPESGGIVGLIMAGGRHCSGGPPGRPAQRVRPPAVRTRCGSCRHGGGAVHVTLP